VEKLLLAQSKKISYGFRVPNILTFVNFGRIKIGHFRVLPPLTKQLEFIIEYITEEEPFALKRSRLVTW